MITSTGIFGFGFGAAAAETGGGKEAEGEGSATSPSFIEVNGTASILSSELRAMVVRLQSTSVSRLWWAEARRLKGYY